MNPTDPPPAVRRWLRRPLWCAGAGLVFALGLVLADRSAASEDRREFATGLHVTGWPEADWDGGDDLQVTYEHPTGQIVAADTYVWDADLLPSKGEPVEVVVSNDDPTSIRVVGDRYRPANPSQYALFVVPFSALWAARRWSLARARRLALGAPMSYQMRGVPSCPGWLSWRWRMHLYALDAAPGSLPVCSVPLVAAPGALGERVVEVKGAPRPWGRVILRDQASGEVLWPSGRCLRIHGWGRHALLPGRTGRPSPIARWLLLAGAMCFLAGVAVDAFGADDSVDVEDRGYPVEARVEGQVRGDEGWKTSVSLDWLGKRVESTVLVQDRREVGDDMRVFLDPTDPTRVWAPGEEAPAHNVTGLLYLVALVLPIPALVVRVRERRAHRRPAIALPPPPQAFVQRPEWPRAGDGVSPPPPPFGA